LSSKASLSQRTVASIGWNMLANFVVIVAGFVRSILLARLLPVETFGVYRWAGSLVALSAVLPNFGMGSAFLHRSEETQDEQTAAATHFTLQLIFSAIWAASLLGYAILGASGDSRLALIVITLVTVGIHLTHTPDLILRRRVVHRRLALYQVTNVLLSSALAVGLAFKNVALWALLSTDVVTLLLGILIFYIWRPFWRPRLTWNPAGIRYYLKFGAQQIGADILVRALDRADDLWVGAYLGDAAMGFYSRAYTFANYPSKIVAAPIDRVIIGTYAELKGDRKRLSQAFFRGSALLIRSGFFVAGVLVLVSPEFIRIALTDKWMPMLDAFQLMLVYTLFDPLKASIAALFVAVGKPNQVMFARAVQFSVLVAGLFVLGPSFNINGIALAVDLMLVVGIALLLWRARIYVDYSIGKLLGIPLLAVGAGIALAAMGRSMIPIASDWLAGGVKIIAFSIVYLGILALLEREHFNMAFQWLKQHYADRLLALVGEVTP
jgi:O-antigen/teichoic acid export membrane protein